MGRKRRLKIKFADARQNVASLSGGNQQKVLLGRVLACSPRLLLMFDATRGVDVGTKSEIYALMRTECSNGVGILFYSSDVAELVNMADRVIVLHDGVVRGKLQAPDDRGIGRCRRSGPAGSHTAGAHRCEQRYGGKGDAARRRRASWPGCRVPGLATLMPYFYVAALTIAILGVEPALIDGPGAVDVRFSAVFPLAIVAFAQTLNLFTRGIDLSIGGTISVVTSILAVSGGVKGPEAYLELLAMLALGTVIGAVNGLIIAYSGLQPFLVTLATWTIWDGIALAVLPVEGGTVPGAGNNLILGSVAGVPKSVLCTAALFVLWAWLRHTRLCPGPAGHGLRCRAGAPHRCPLVPAHGPVLLVLRRLRRHRRASGSPSRKPPALPPRATSTYSPRSPPSSSVGPASSGERGRRPPPWSGRSPT